MVDIGGSHGSIAIEILRKCPRMRCIVQDLEEVIEEAEVPIDTGNRLTFQKHNFLSNQIVLGVDV